MPEYKKYAMCRSVDTNQFIKGNYMPPAQTVIAEIERVVSDEWHRRPGGPLLISKLGMRLTPDAKADISDSGYGLKRYLQEYLADSLRLVPMRSRGGGVAPTADTIDLTDEEIEARYVERSDSDAPPRSVPTYWGEVWRAFQKPLAEDTVRYVLFDSSGKPEVGMAAKEASLPSNAKLIEASDLVLSEQEGLLPPRLAVHQAIENWCRREGVPLENLEFKRPTTQKSSGSTLPLENKVGRVRGDRNAAASLGLHLLTREELARISIPADLVLAIFERAGHQ